MQPKFNGTHLITLTNNNILWLSFWFQNMLILTRRKHFSNQTTAMSISYCMTHLCRPKQIYDKEVRNRWIFSSNKFTLILFTRLPQLCYPDGSLRMESISSIFFMLDLKKKKEKNLICLKTFHMRDPVVTIAQLTDILFILLTRTHIKFQ